uniref:Uncharacterized protein n=1 Tax=Cannabis sativa TaxID=3483 RepID=A0A803PNP1_CANSA
MAETVISVMVQLLTSLPLEAIIKGVNELRNVERRVDNLTRKLRSIRAVLQDAENGRWTSNRESVKDWLEMLEDDSHEMTNVLDRWNTLILRSQIKKDFNQRRKFSGNLLGVIASRFRVQIRQRVISHHAILHQIEEIEEKVNVAVGQISSLGLVEKLVTNDQVLSRALETTSFVDEIEIHGRDLDKKALLQMLMPNDTITHGHDGPLEVISVVGMGGLGKTTLAQLAFNNEAIKNHFPKKIWYLTKRECEIIEAFNIVDLVADQKRSKRKLRQRIRHLTITMESEAEFPKLELSNDNKKFLHTFHILRQAVAKLPSLEALEFWGLRAKFIGLELLGLVLGDTDDDEVRVLYPKLKVLKFTSAENWCEWKTESLMIKIMPVLESLYFWSCSSLGVLPGFLCNVKSLKFIHISNATKLEKHCRVRDENEWPKISHSKNILLNGVHVQKEGRYLLH